MTNEPLSFDEFRARLRARSEIRTPARGGGAPSGVLPGGFPDLLVVEVVDDDGWLSEVRHAVVLGAEIRQAMV